MAYAGLPVQTLVYLRGLEAQNSRAWFEAHRVEYERFWLGAGLDLIAALSGPVADLGLLAVPKLNASLRRIHRDVRFSKDKRPYEPRLHVILSSGEAFNRAPGVHLVVGPVGIGFGAGVHGMEPRELESYRRRLQDADQRAELEAALAKGAAVGAVLDPPDLARVPKGYEAAPWDILLRRRSVILRSQGDVAHPNWLHGPAAVEGWMGLVSGLVPLVNWLNRGRARITLA